MKHSKLLKIWGDDIPSALDYMADRACSVLSDIELSDRKQNSSVPKNVETRVNDFIKQIRRLEKEYKVLEEVIFEEYGQSNSIGKNL